MEKQYKTNQEKKQQKVSRNRMETARLIKEAARNILHEEGIESISINKLERVSGKSKKLIYNYFGDLSGLLKEVLQDNDPWLDYENKIEQLLEVHGEDRGRELTSIILKSHLYRFSKDSVFQKISLMELTEEDQTLLKEICTSREMLGERFFQLTDEQFKNSEIDIRYIVALLIGGINYLVLHRESNGSTFCGADISKEDDLRKFRKTLEQIVC